MVTKQKKYEIVAELVEKLNASSGYYLVDFTGLTVAETITFRRELKKKKVDYKVAKNTLIARAIEEVGGAELPADVLVGATGVAFVKDDLAAPAKVILEVSGKSGKPKLKGAFVDGQFFAGTQIKELAALPTKEDLISSIIGSIHAPISGIVGSINAVMRDLISVIDEAVKTKAA